MNHLPRSTEGPNWHSFAPITSYDHAGYIWIAALYCMTMGMLVLSTRIWIKKNAFGHDDGCFIAATVAMLAHVAAIFVSLKHGLGSSPATQLRRDTSSTRLETGGRASMAADMFLLISLGIAKCAVVMFVQRLLSRDQKVLRLSCYGLVGVFALWTIGSMIGIGIDCNAEQYLADDMAIQCGSQGRRWTIIAAFDILTEILLVVMPVIIVWPLQMTTKLKLSVTSAFSFRLGVAALSIAHACYASRVPQNPHPSLAFVPKIVFAEAELCWSLISATIPNLKAFMKSFNTGFGQNDFAFTMTGSGYQNSKQNSNAIQLSRLSRSQTSARRASNFMPSLRPDGAYEVEVMRGRSGDEMSLGSGQSEEMIIRKQVTMTVDSESNSKRRYGKGI